MTRDIAIRFNQTFGDEELKHKTAEQTKLTEDRAEILAVRNGKRKNKPKKQKKFAVKADVRTRNSV